MMSNESLNYNKNLNYRRRRCKLKGLIRKSVIVKVIIIRKLK